MCFTTKLAQRLRKPGFRNVSDIAVEASFQKSSNFMCFTRNLAQRLRKPCFRNVSEPLSQCHLLHSNPLHSTLLHSATLSNETLQNKYFWALWIEKSFDLCYVSHNVKRNYRETSWQVTFLTLLLRGAAETLLSFACLPSHQNVTKQCMFS